MQFYRINHCVVSEFELERKLNVLAGAQKSRHWIRWDLSVKRSSCIGRFFWKIFNCSKGFRYAFFRVNLRQSRDTLNSLKAQIQPNNRLYPLFRRAVFNYNTIVKHHKVDLYAPNLFPSRPPVFHRSPNFIPPVFHRSPNFFPQPVRRVPERVNMDEVFKNVEDAQEGEDECPITLGKINVLAITPCGHKFERAAIEGVYKAQRALKAPCPVCRAPFDLNDIKPEIVSAR